MCALPLGVVVQRWRKPRPSPLGLHSLEERQINSVSAKPLGPPLFYPQSHFCLNHFCFLSNLRCTR